MALLRRDIFTPILGLSFLLISNQHSSAETSKVFQCEGVMDYQYEHIGEAYNELYPRGRRVTFKFAKYEKHLEFIDGWPRLAGRKMMLAPTYGGNVHGLILDQGDVENGQLSMVFSFWMYFNGDYTFARNGVFGVLTSVGKCKPLS